MLPRKMRATLLQHFDASRIVQTLLKVVLRWILAGRRASSPRSVCRRRTARAAHLLSLAVADGLVEEVPPGGLIAAATPAPRGRRWTHMVMRSRSSSRSSRSSASVLWIFDELIEYHERTPGASSARRAPGAAFRA